MFQVEDSWTSLIGGLLAATRGLLKTRRDRSEPKMFDEDDVELSDEYADDDDRGSDDGTGIHTLQTTLTLRGSLINQSLEYTESQISFFMMLRYHFLIGNQRYFENIEKYSGFWRVCTPVC